MACCTLHWAWLPWASENAEQLYWGHLVSLRLLLPTFLMVNCYFHLPSIFCTTERTDKQLSSGMLFQSVFHCLRFLSFFLSLFSRLILLSEYQGKGFCALQILVNDSDCLHQGHWKDSKRRAGVHMWPSLWKPSQSNFFHDLLFSTKKIILPKEHSVEM